MVKNGNKYIVLPPFPITEDKISLGKLDASPLLEALEREYIIGVVVVTWGTYSIGVFHRENLVKLKTGTGYIHKEHRKGGRSEKRFARRTEEQKKDFLRRVSNRIEEKFENYTLDYIFLGGNRLIRAPLLRECKYLQREAQKISQRALNLRYENKESLEPHSKRDNKLFRFYFLRLFPKRYQHALRNKYPLKIQACSPVDFTQMQIAVISMRDPTHHPVTAVEI